MSGSPLSYLDQFGDGGRIFNAADEHQQAALAANLARAHAELAMQNMQLQQRISLSEIRAAAQKRVYQASSTATYGVYGGLHSGTGAWAAPIGLQQMADLGPWPWPQTPAAVLAQRAKTARYRKIAIATLAGILTPAVILLAIGLVFG